MKKYALLLDKEKFKRKPAGSEIAKISENIVNEPAEVTPKELAEFVGSQGQTMVLATMKGKRKKENMVSQQVLAIDFDNSETRLNMMGDVIKTESGKAKKFKTKGKNYTDVAEVYQDKWVQNNAAFIYTTFSHQDDWHHFRLVFFLDKPLTQPDQVERAYRWLMDRFPTADKSTKDASRLFFGGNESVEINYENTLAIDTFKAKENKTTKKEKKDICISPSKITNEQAMEAIKAYVKKEKNNLQDYDNCLSAIWVIARAAKTGEISYPIAQDLADYLSLGNEEWLEGNRVKFKEALETPLGEMHTSYSFAEKFCGGGLNPQGIDKNNMITTAKFLVNELNIKLFKGRLYFKQDHCFINNDNILLRKITKYIELKNSQDTELMHQFEKYAELITEDHFPIQFRNDYYLKDGKIIEGYYDNFTPYYLNVDYAPSAFDADVDRFLNFLTCDRSDLRFVLEEMMGHILMDRGFPHKVFFLIGERGANGKSTFLEMLNAFTGSLATNISLENFNDPTSVVELEGKLVNIGDDINASFLDKSSNFKILASGNTLMVRPIYSTPYRMKNKATLIFTANEMPLFKDKSGGIERRLVLIPCDNVVQKIDFRINDKLSTANAKSYLLNLALAGMYRIQSNGGKISKSQAIESLVNEYTFESNSVLQFLDEKGVHPYFTAQQVYDDYVSYCKKLEIKPYSRIKFSKHLKTQGYERTKKQKNKIRAYFYEKKK